ncbi:MAG: lipopolysaccharide biosynthesis protein [Bacteroidaceae bacterium]|nr:lipopolysaccharide biosynthesis protein [Bacteroidaceae bacterium]
MSNSRIARNTLYLYGQQIVQMIVGLVTTRVLIQSLGKIDYGLFSVLGGVMSVFMVLNAIEAATMRFITFEQGKGSDTARIHVVFSTAQHVHFAIAGIVLLVAETIGMYYVCNHLVMPPERLTAVIVVFQLYLVATLFAIISAPFDALIVAHERMGVFASISIYQTFINLAIVFIVKYAETDRLILYAALIMLLQVSLRLIYGWYCNRHFPETRGRWVFDRKLFSQMFRFGIWSFNGTLATIGYTQGINLLLNYFFGPLLNTAFSLANSVYSKLYSFAENFLIAVKPQLVKSYAAGNLDNMHRLMITSSQLGVYLMFIMSLPVMLETHFIYYLWIGEVTDHTVWFLRIALFSIGVNTLGNVMTMSIQATGRIAKYQLIEGNLLLLTVPLAWFCLWKGLPPESVFCVQLLMFVITQVARTLIVCPALQMSIWYYVRKVMIRPAIVILIGSIIPVLVHNYGGLSTHPITQVIIVTFVSLLSSSLAVYYIGCSSSQRQLVRQKLRNIIHR